MMWTHHLVLNELLKRNLLSLFIYEKCEKIKLDTTLDSFIGEYLIKTQGNNLAYYMYFVQSCARVEELL